MPNTQLFISERKKKTFFFLFRAPCALNLSLPALPALRRIYELDKDSHLTCSHGILEPVVYLRERSCLGDDKPLFE